MLSKMIKSLASIDMDEVNMLITLLERVKINDGRLFILGVGGSAANASHAVNDFRKLCNIEAYAPSDNVSELTARTNDDGWESTYVNWLKVSKLSSEDAILVLSVGGGNKEHNVSMNLVKAIDYAKEVNAYVLGIVSRDGGYTRVNASASVLIPVEDQSIVTPVAESMQSVILHMIVSHAFLQENRTKW